jgi:peptidoglycan hydrolase CwlO-like protein
MDNIYIKAENLNEWILRHLPKKDLITIDDLIGAIEDMDSEIESLKEKIEDIEQDIEDNYKPVSKAEQYNVSESWFH